MMGLLERVELYFMFTSDKRRKIKRISIGGRERDVPLINKDVGLTSLLAFYGNQEMKST